MKPPSATALLKVRVQPRSSREGLTRSADGKLHVRVSVAPVDGEANEAVLRVLSKALGLRKSQFSLVCGHTSRLKLVKVTGIGLEELARLLPPPSK